jgi:two-component system, sporulation sensor kinase B
MYALYSTVKIPKNKVTELVLLQVLMIPAEAAYFVFPALRMFAPLWKHTEAERILYTRMMNFLITPYFVVAIIVLIVGWLKERDRVLREERAINCLLLVPAGLCLYLSSYLIPSFGVIDAWKINIVLIIAVSAMFVFFGIRKSAMGFHLRQENASRVQTQQAVIQSSGVLNHALKNNLLTTRLSLQNAKYHMGQEDVSREAIAKDIDLALNTCEHTLAILDRIHLQFQPILMNPEDASIIDILEDAAGQSFSSYPNKIVEIEKNWEFTPRLYCDPVHMREALLNLINNAMEAVSEDGTGKISLSTHSRHGRLVILISDNGCGIEKKQWRNVGIPLFTTKSGKNHYGLGLFYVKKVVQMHDAHFDLRSAPGGLTVAELFFPPSRIRKGD